MTSDDRGTSPIARDSTAGDSRYSMYTTWGGGAGKEIFQKLAMFAPDPVFTPTDRVRSQCRPLLNKSPRHLNKSRGEMVKCRRHLNKWRGELIKSRGDLYTSGVGEVVCPFGTPVCCGLVRVCRRHLFISRRQHVKARGDLASSRAPLSESRALLTKARFQTAEGNPHCDTTDTFWDVRARMTSCSFPPRGRLLEILCRRAIPGPES